MKTLKESILNRSSHGAKGFEAQRRKMIEDWLKKYNIEKYTINDDFTIDVDGFVLLDKENLKELPEYIQFGVVKGSFYCSMNNLTSLRGCPREVEKSFYCTHNKLTSLIGAPEKVGEYFDCTANNLTSLVGSPREIRGLFNCNYNQLTSLEGAPEKVGNDFYCKNNNLTSLVGSPKEVRGNFDCRSNNIQFTEDDVRKICHVGRRIIV